MPKLIERMSSKMKIKSEIHLCLL